MIKLIFKLSEKIECHYNLFADKVPPNSKSQLDLMIDIIHKRILTDMLTKNSFGEYMVGDLNNIWVNYNLFDAQDYYISFYDSTNNDDWLDVCEKKYGERELILDPEMPLLHFSKENIEEVLRSWEKLQNFDHKYLIITEYDNGWIDLEGKQELSDDDMKIVESSKKYIQW